jgi:hypothetical protein
VAAHPCAGQATGDECQGVRPVDLVRRQLGLPGEQQEDQQRAVAPVARGRWNGHGHSISCGPFASS